MPNRGQAGWKSRAKRLAELIGSDNMVKAEVVPVEAPTWDTLQNKPTNLATTDQLPTVPSNIVTHDGSGNVTITGDLTANDVVIN